MKYILKKYRRGKKKSILCMIDGIASKKFAKNCLVIGCKNWFWYYRKIVLATLWSFFIFSPFLSCMNSFSSQMIAPTDFWNLWSISVCCIKGISLRLCNKSSLIYNSNKKYNNNNNNNIYLLQLGCHLVAVVILHVNKTWNWLLLNLSREGYMRSM